MKDRCRCLRTRKTLLFVGLVFAFAVVALARSPAKIPSLGQEVVYQHNATTSRCALVAVPTTNQIATLAAMATVDAEETITWKRRIDVPHDPTGVTFPSWRYVGDKRE